MRKFLLEGRRGCPWCKRPEVDLLREPEGNLVISYHFDPRGERGFCEGSMASGPMTALMSHPSKD